VSYAPRSGPRHATSGIPALAGSCQLLEYGVHDMIRAAMDETRIVVQDLFGRNFDGDFLQGNHSLLLD